MRIIIPGTPIPQARPRVGRWGVFDPNGEAKKQIKAYLNEHYGDNRLLQHPRLSFIFHMPIPKTISKAEYIAAMTGLKKHEKKPDNDNILKLYMDCMDGIIYEADQKVQIGFCYKLFHPYPKTIIIAQECSEFLTQHEVDPGTWALLTASECAQQNADEMACQPDFYSPDHLDDSLSYKPSYPLFEAINKVLLQPVQAVLESVYTAFRKTAPAV